MSFSRRLEALATVESSLRVLLRKRAIRQEDVSDFWKVHDRLGLTLRDSRSVRAKVLLEHIDRVLADRTVTDEEASRLRNLCDFLKIDPSEPRVRNALAKVDRAFTLDRLQRGVLPVIPPEQCQINVSPGEKVHAQFRSEMMEERAVRSGYRGGSSGVSFRITRGVRWYVGGSRGAFVSEKELTVVGSGLLCVTSRRIVFLGYPKTLSFAWPKVLGVVPYKDGLLVQVANRTQSPFFRLGDPTEVQVAAAICNALFNRT